MFLVFIFKIVHYFIFMSKASNFDLLSQIFDDGFRILSCLLILSGIESCV